MTMPRGPPFIGGNGAGRRRLPRGVAVTAVYSPARAGERTKASVCLRAASGQPPHESYKNSLLGPPPFPCAPTLSMDSEVLEPFNARRTPGAPATAWPRAWIGRSVPVAAASVGGL